MEDNGVVMFEDFGVCDVGVGYVVVDVVGVVLVWFCVIVICDGFVVFEVFDGIFVSLVVIEIECEVVVVVLVGGVSFEGFEDDVGDVLVGENVVINNGGIRGG